MTPVRRSLLKGAAALATLAGVPSFVRAQTTFPATSPVSTERRFAPQAGQWRTFEVTTRVEIAQAKGPTRVWLPVPSINSDWQRSLESSFASNGTSRMTSDGEQGARMLYTAFPASVAKPFVEITSRVQTQNRQVNLDLAASPAFTREDAGTQRFYTPCHALAADRRHCAHHRAGSHPRGPRRCAKSPCHLQLGGGQCLARTQGAWLW